MTSTDKKCCEPVRQMRRCYVCKQTLPLEDFGKSKDKSLGHGYRCHECKRIYSRIRIVSPEAKARRVAADRARQIRNRTQNTARQWAYVLTRPGERERFRVRAKLQSAVRSGAIKRLPCSVCGNVKSHGHHEDYSKPLDVMWLCVVHHAERHKEMRVLSRTPNSPKQ